MVCLLRNCRLPILVIFLNILCAFGNFDATGQAAEDKPSPPWLVSYGLAVNVTNSGAFQDFLPSTAVSSTHTLELALELERQFNPVTALRLALFGTDYRVEDDIVPSGFAEPGSLESQSVGLTGAVDFRLSGFTLTPEIVVSYDDYRLERPDTLLGARAISTSDGWRADLALSLGRDIFLADWALLQPSGSIKYSRLQADAFTETGAGFNNASVGEIVDHRVRVDLGAVLSAFTVSKQHGTFSAFAGAKWAHNFLTGPYSATASTPLLGNLGEVGIARGAEKNGFSLLGGAKWQMSGHLDLLLAYNGEFFSSTASHTGLAAIGLRF